MKVVVDASAGLASVLGHVAATSILDQVETAESVIAPDLFAAEVTSGLWKYVIAKQLSIDAATERLRAAMQMIDGFHSVAAFAPEVLREASARRHSVYDLCYAVLARREGAVLLTIDGRLKRLALSMGVAAHP